MLCLILGAYCQHRANHIAYTNLLLMIINFTRLTKLKFMLHSHS